MLFAAGFGTRMQPLTLTRPKPLVQVAGRALIDHALDQAAPLPGLKIVANAHYLPDQIVDHLAPRGIPVLVEDPEILDTGGGLKNALPLLGDGPVFTMNTDAVWSGPSPLALLADAWDGDRMDALLMCVSPENAVGHAGTGDFVDTGGRVTRGPGLIYSGAQVIRTEGLAEIDRTAFSLNLLWDRMLNAGRLHILSYPGRWCDVGHPGGIALAEEMLADV